MIGMVGLNFFFLFAVKCTFKNKTLTIAALHLHVVRSCHLKDKLFYDTDQFYNFSASLHTIVRYNEIKVSIN
jgi:hypothetical protein